jgi:cholesterol transport system auxiliary component
MTIRRRSPARRLAIAAICSVAAGCITVLPKQPPIQLYRFGAASAAPAGRPSTPRAAFTVRLAPMDFDGGAAGDLILTVAGGQAAYVRGARWLVPAEDMFRSAVVRAFAADVGGVRLVEPGDPSAIDDTLKLDVRAFEARYADPKAPPTVVVEFYASITRLKDRTSLGHRTFRAEAPASENRMSTIAAAFDQAVGKALGELVSWVNAKGVSG